MTPIGSGKSDDRALTGERYRVGVGGVAPEALPDVMKRSLEAVLKEWPLPVGVTLFISDFGNGGGLSYISNADRADMVGVVREWLQHQIKLS